MPSTRVVVTGLGATSPVGGDVASTWQALLAGTSGIGYLDDEWVETLPVRIGGRVVARDLMTLTLICDHRILYGADGAAFLAQVRELLEQPLSLAL